MSHFKIHIIDGNRTLQEKLRLQGMSDAEQAMFNFNTLSDRQCAIIAGNATRTYYASLSLGANTALQQVYDNL